MNEGFDYLEANGAAFLIFMALIAGILVWNGARQSRK